MHVKVSNMCMIKRGNEVLIQQRSKQDWPGITFPGGKQEDHESVYESMIREIHEETGLNIIHASLCGIVEYQLLHKEERWLIFLFKSECFSGEIIQNEKEDAIYWMPYEALQTVALSNDLEKYIEIYENDKIIQGYAYWDGQTSSQFTLR